MSSRSISSIAVAIVITAFISLIIGIILLCVAANKNEVDGDDKQRRFIYISGHVMCALGGVALGCLILTCCCYLSMGASSTARSKAMQDDSGRVTGQTAKIGQSRNGLIGANIGSLRPPRSSTSSSRPPKSQHGMRSSKGDLGMNQLETYAKFNPDIPSNWSNSVQSGSLSPLDLNCNRMSSQLMLPSRLDSFTSTTSSLGSQKLSTALLLPLKGPGSAFNAHPLHTDNSGLQGSVLHSSNRLRLGDV